MSVAIASQLRAQLLDAGIDPDAFSDHFLEWKVDWPKREYSFELFGKDGAYQFPKVDGDKYVLRHVHLMPMVDLEKATLWQRAFRREGRKTSDRHLVYVEDGRGGYLLIYILDEPTAHAVAQMRTPGDTSLMEKFAWVAEDFLYDGTVP